MLLDSKDTAESVKNVEVTTKYVDIEKIANRNKKNVNMDDDNTELAGEMSRTM